MNRMVPLAALVNWDYRPRWGTENFLGDVFNKVSGINIFFAIASIPVVWFLLPLAIKVPIKEGILLAILAIITAILTLVGGPMIWLNLLAVLLVVYPLVMIILEHKGAIKIS